MCTPVTFAYVRIYLYSVCQPGDAGQAAGEQGAQLQPQEEGVGEAQQSCRQTHGQLNNIENNFCKYALYVLLFLYFIIYFEISIYI